MRPDLDSPAIKALLVSRALLVKIKRDIENQVRGLLKNLGLVIGQAKMKVFAVRAAELAESRPELAAAVEPLLKAREAVEQQIADLDRKVLRLARNNAQVRRLPPQHPHVAPSVGQVDPIKVMSTARDLPTTVKDLPTIEFADHTFVTKGSFATFGAIMTRRPIPRPGGVVTSPGPSHQPAGRALTLPASNSQTVWIWRQINGS